MNVLNRLYKQLTGKEPREMIEFAASGSNRFYFRLIGEKENLIGVQGTSADENEAFLYMSNHFESKGLPVPRVLIQSEDGKFYIQDDLGDMLLFDYIAEGRKTGVFCEEEKKMLRKTMRKLAHIQIEGARDFDFSKCYPQPEFNRRTVLWDLNYFKYCFLKPAGLEFQEDRLEDEFALFADELTRFDTNTFMYRDFQSRNVMIKDGEPYFIDFQGGRRGPVYYDVASFLWQAKARYSADLRRELTEEYLDELSTLQDVNREEFYKVLNRFVLFRTLQVLGAYGYRGYFEKKPHFLQSIPFAVENLRSILDSEPDNHSYLFEVLRDMTELKQFKEVSIRKPLVVRVYSFSYKKGIPYDDSGNGGGFVFDCRAVNNPGKYDRYKSLTGLDKPVIDFLEDDGEIIPFLKSVYALTDASVERYKDRGFTDLMISFGCTGGQHRSVYSAQKVAERINKRFGVEVRLVHREQNIEKILLP